MDGYGAHAYPVRLWRFPTGLHVVDADPAHRDLVGGRVETLAGHPIAAVTAAVDPIVSRDNPHTVDTFGAVLHTIPEILHGLGLAPSVGPADIAVRMPDGTTRTARLEPVPMPAFRERSGPAFPLRIAPHRPTLRRCGCATSIGPPTSSGSPTPGRRTSASPGARAAPRRSPTSCARWSPRNVRNGSSSTCATTSAATTSPTLLCWTRCATRRSTGPGGCSC